MLVMVGLFGHLFGMFFASPAVELPMGRPAMNSARRRICGSPRPSACIFILPVESDSKIFSGVISRIASAVGPWFGPGLLWHIEQRVWNEDHPLSVPGKPPPRPAPAACGAAWGAGAAGS